MRKHSLVKKIWNYIANNDEYANIIVDGKIDEASILIVNLIEMLSNTGALAKHLNTGDNCIKPDVMQQRELLLAFCEHIFKNDLYISPKWYNMHIKSFLANNCA